MSAQTKTDEAAAAEPAKTLSPAAQRALAEAQTPLLKSECAKGDLDDWIPVAAHAADDDAEAGEEPRGRRRR